LQEVRDPQGNTLFLQEKPEMAGNLDVKKGNLDIVREGMNLVINGEKGTAKKARNSKITLSGKTGTAEIGPRNDRKTNTWFIGFGQRDGKLYGIAVIVQEGVSGGSTCAPIVSKFFEEWLPPRKAFSEGIENIEAEE
jgi:penicillin-binding protein 2